MEKFNNIKKITKSDALYPKSLEQAVPPPETIYYKGDVSLLGKRMVAVVGARKCSEYGKRVALQLGKILSQSGFVLISGMALGIDAFGHMGVLQNQGKTVAVLGCGVDICYPAANKKLYKEIEEKGLLLSEYPPGTSPMPYFFPQRNRIIAALAEAVVVIEAGKRSGAFITADLGEEMGKRVYSVPGNITSPYSLGTNQLIADGALPLVTLEDVIRDLGGVVYAGKKEENGLSDLEREILRYLEEEGEVALEKICQTFRKNAAEINGVIAVLEIKGWVAYQYGKIFLAK